MAQLVQQAGLIALFLLNYRIKWKIYFHSWVSPKLVKSERLKEKRERKVKVSVNNGQVKAWTQNYIKNTDYVS